jgi:hypothetical protein
MAGTIDKSETVVTQHDLEARADFRGAHLAMSKILDLVRSRTVEVPPAVIDNTGSYGYDSGYFIAPLAPRTPNSPAELAEAGLAPVSPAPVNAGALAAGETVQIVIPAPTQGQMQPA